MIVISKLGFCPPKMAVCAISRGLLTMALLCGLANNLRAVNLVQEFYLPMPEAQIYQANSSIISGTSSSILSTFSIVVTGNGTVIYYDQWEDGYETDLSNPTQPTTQIWGDGNDAHGIPPGFAHNPAGGLAAGTVITLTNVVTQPRNPGTILWDARDRIAANKALVISRAAWPVKPGPVFAGAAVVLSTMDYGTNFISPFGQNLTNNLFKYVGMFIMAAQNNTAITIDPNGNGVGTTNIVLNQGESYLVNGGVKTGGRVSASEPIQADVIIGHVGASYASDWFTLYPVQSWSSAYYTPVGSAATVSQPAYVYVYNPNSNPITINYSTKVGAGSFSVPGTNGVYQFQMPVSSGASFVNTNGQNFFAGSTVAANNSSDCAWNWGFTLVPAAALTTAATVGWAPGTADGSADGSPVWVTALGNTTLYVDYKGDYSGPLTDPAGSHYDTNFTVTALQSQKIYDPSLNQTGMRIYTLDGTLLTAAWGEDPDVAAVGDPFIDAGTTVLPFPIPKITKTATDENSGAGIFSVGDTLLYTVEVDNKGLLPLGNLVVIDGPATNLSYVPGSTTLNGVPIPDSTTGTAFPLDTPGYTIPVILSEGSSVFQYSCTINAPGAITNAFSASAYGIVTVARVNTPSTNNPNPQCFVNFTATAGGSTASNFVVGGSIFITLTNAAANTRTNAVDTASVVVQDTTSGDYETITLTETGSNTGVFTNFALPTSITAGLNPNDGTLNVAIGDSLLINYTDPTYGSSSTATAVMLAATQTKVLYLSNTNGPQSLNRINPVAAADPYTASTAILLGGTNYQTIGVDNVASGTSTAGTYTQSFAVGTGANRLMLAGLSYSFTNMVTGVTYGGAPLTKVMGTNNTTVNAANFRPRSEIWSLVNPPSGTANLVVTFSNSTSMYLTAGILTFSNVNQATPFGKTSAKAAKSKTQYVVVASTANSLVLGVLAVKQGTYTAKSGTIAEWNTTPGSVVQGCGSTTNGVASASVGWSNSISQYYAATAVSINPAIGAATNFTTFTQNPAFCQNFVMPLGSAVIITNWVTVTSGTLPASPAVTATLLNGTNAFLTLSNPTFNSSSNYLVWSGTLSSNVTVAATNAINYVVSNQQAGVSFKVNYGSQTNASKILLPTTTVISARSLGIYDAPYPGGALQTAPYNGQTLYARAVVSDPFGSYDISSVGLVIDGPGTASDIATTLTNANVVYDDGTNRTYEYVWQTGATTGAYTITATANEGTEGITNSISTAVTLNFLDLGTPSTTQFTGGNNGVHTNSFAANGTAWIRVIDINRNTNATTKETVAATVTSSSGDSELVLLTETGTNTGVFAGSINLTNSATAINSGTLTAAAGSLIQVTYTDITDSSDVSSDTATIPTPAGTGAIQVTDTLLTPSQVLLGNPVQFSVQVFNSGSTNLPTITLTNSYPTSALTFVSASTTPGTVVGTNLIWSNIGPLAPGQSTNLVLTFAASGSASPATAAALANGSGGVTGSASANVTITHPALTITKTKLSPTNSVVSIGSNVVFQIVIQNTGSTTVPTVPLEDDYSAAAYQYVSATIPPDGAGGGILVWNNITATNSLAANAALTNLVTMKVVGQGHPAYNTAHADFATDVNGNAVPAATSTASVTNAAAGITGSVYNDVNQSGVYNANDAGLGNVALQLYTDPNGDGNPSDGVLVQLATTDASGFYEFLNLTTGNYVVIETDLAGYASSSPVNNRLAVNVNSLNTFSNNCFFNYVLAVTNYASVSGHVWFDSNQNGVHDAGEPGVTNAFVELIQDANTNGLADPGEPVVASAYADTNGLFTFQNVAPGNYVVLEINFFGWISTGNSLGTNNNQVGVTLGSGASVTNVWFLNYTAGGANGYYPPAAAPDSYSVFENTTLSASATNGIFANDFCTSGITNLTAVLVSAATNGTLTLNTNTGAFTYAPNANFFGADTFIYKVSDGTTNSSPAAVAITIAAVNQPPSFTAGVNQTVLENAAAQSVANWATAISPGPANESSQTVTFQVSNNNSNLFSAEPAITPTGTLSYHPATNANGSATVTVYLQDSGGTANGGHNTSATNTFTITVTAVNQPPSFSLVTNNVVVLENGGAQSLALATNLSVGPPNESAQTLAFFVSNDSSNLFSAQPAMATNGTLTFAVAASSNGVATVTVYAQDSGGTANGGHDTSATNTFTITVTPVNQPPTLAAIGNQTILENAGLQTVNLSGISPGPPNESSQTIVLTVTSSNPGLIPNPIIGYTNGNTTGTLTYAPTANSNGVATVTVVAVDNGGTGNGGVNATTNTFTVTVTAVNQPPSFVKGFDVSVNRLAGPQSLPNWATAIQPGPPNEDGQTVTFIVTNDANSLFAVQPQLSSGGTLSFAPATSANGQATVTVVAHDNGGTANGGIDTSAPQTFLVAIGASELIRATGGEAISADTVGGAWTTLSGPTYMEGNSGAIGAGTIILQIPAGFAFDTGGVAPTVLVQRNNGTAADSLNLNGATNGQAFAMTSVTSTQIVFTVTNASSGLVSDTLTFTNLRVRPTAGNLASGELVITSSGTAVIQQVQPDATSWGSLAEIPGTAAQLAIGTEPSATATAGAAFAQQPVIWIEDAYGNLATNASGTVTAARIAGSGTLQGTLTATAVNGVATFASLFHNVATNITIAFSSGSLPPVTSTVVSIQAAAADHLVLVQGNHQTGTAAAVLPVNPTVQVVDAFTNPVSGATVTFAVQSGGGSVGTATVASDVSGLAATTYTLGTASGTDNNTIRAAVSGLPGTPASLTFAESAAPGTAAKLAIETEPSATAMAGVAFAQQPVVVVEDQYGNLLASANGLTVTASRAAGSGALQGSLVAGLVNGVAVFSGLNDTVATNITITFSSPGLTPVTSTVVAIFAAGADHLVLVQGNNQTNTVTAVLPLNPTVEVVDAFGNPVAGVNVTFTVQSGGGSVGTATVASAGNGLAATTYTLGTVAGAGNNSMNAFATVAGNPNHLTFTASAVAGTAAQLAIQTEPSATATAGVNFVQQPVVWVADAYGNLVSSAAGIVTASRNAGSGSLQGMLSASIVNGVATFTSLHHDVAGNITLNFASYGFSPVTSSVVAINAAGADHLLLVQGNNQSAIVATAVGVNPTVEVVDAFGNPVPGVSVGFAVQSGGGRVVAATVVSDVNGQAAAGYTLGKVAGTANNTMQASATVAGTPGSLSFTESALVGTASKLAVYTQPSSSATAGVTFVQQPVVCVEDAYGNIVPSASGSVTAVRAAGSGDLQGTLTVTMVGGMAAYTDLSHDVATNITITFTSGILAPVTSTAIAVTAATADHLDVVTGDGLTGTIKQPLQVNPTVQVVDAYENPVAGSNVAFTVTTTGMSKGNNGSVSASSVTSDANGLASSIYTLGGDVGIGNNTMDAALGTLDDHLFTESGATPGLPVADVVTTVTAPAAVGIAQQITYQITVQNTGPSNAVNVVVTDLLPPDATGAVASSGGNISGSQVTWTIATLTNGVSSNLTVTVTAPGNVESLSDTVSSTSDTYDPQSGNNDGSAPGATAVTSVQSADVRTTITGPVSVTAGTNLIYTILVSNLGPSTATGVTLTNFVPAGLTIVDASGGTISGNIVTWNIGGLASGGWDSFTMTLTPPTTGGTFTNLAASVAATYDPVAGNNNGTAASGGVITVVAPLNVAPTLNAISNQTLNENAGQQTVNLAGIAAGGGVSQTLTVTATSSNPGLIPNPTVGYTSPNPTGTLTFTPVANANGSATVTVVVHDNGGTANGGVDSVTNTFTVTVNAVNQPPSFTSGGNQTVLENAGAQSVANWAASLSAGPPNESSQTLTFHLSNNNSGLFSAPPAISSSGTLTYTPAANANGNATVTVYLQDNGGTANGGHDTSATNTFTINVTPVNQPPSFSLLTNNVVVLENGGAQSLSLASNISPGPANESTQTVAFLVGNNNSSLFSTPPAVSASGTLTFVPAANANGTATVTVNAQDNGGTANGGVDTSPAQTLNITVTPVNQPPTLNPISNLTLNENAGVQTVSLSGISAGPPNETNSQTLSVRVASSAISIIPTPTVNYSSPNATGTLTFTPVTQAHGQATITVIVQDSGGTANGGIDSVTNTFTVTVNDSNSPTAGPVSASESTVAASPASVTADGTTTSIVTATLMDTSGNPVSGKTVTLAQTSGAGTPTITTTQGTTDGSGVATFTVKSTTAAVDRFTATDTSDSLTISPTATVTFTVGAASQLVFRTQPPASTVAGMAFATQPVVQIEDQYGNVVTSGADATVSVALTLTTGAGTLSGSTSMNAVNGVADFAGKGLSINRVGTDKVLTAAATVTAGAKAATTSPAFAITLPPISLLRGPGTGYKIHVLRDLLTPDASWDGYAPLNYVSCSSPTTNGVVLAISGSGTNTMIVYPSSAVNLADSFTYTVSDGDSNTWTGTVNIIINTNLTGQGGGISAGGSSPLMTFHGLPGYHYAVQRATDLTGPWTDIQVASTNACVDTTPGYGVITSPAGGAFSITDPSPPSNSAYYHLRALP